LRILLRQAQAEESPSGAHAVIAIGHVARRAHRCARPVEGGLVGVLEPVAQLHVPIPVTAFNGVNRSVFGGRVHLPLRMVEAHVAGHAGFRTAGFRGGEAVTRVAGIALAFVEPDAMAASAPFYAL